MNSEERKRMRYFFTFFGHMKKISLHLSTKECGGEWSFHIHATKAHTVQQEYAG